MSEINMNKIVGDTFEDMSITEMTIVQGSGDISGEFTTSPACLASSVKCAGAVSAIASAVSGVIVSIVKC